MLRFRLSAIPFRIYLTAVLLLLVIPVLIVAGIVSYRASRRSLQDEAVASLQATANSYREQVTAVLQRKHERAAATLTAIELGCEVTGRMNGLCAREMLRGFRKSEGAQSALLIDRRGRRLQTGGSEPVVPPPPSDLGSFSMVDSRVVVTVASSDAESGLTLAANYDSDSLAAPAQARREVLLVGMADGQPRALFDETNALPTLRRLNESALSSCLGGQNSRQVVGSEQRDRVYQVFRHVEGVGGGCVVSFIHEAEVLGPADRLRRKMQQLGVIFGIVAVALAYALAFAATRPLFRLRQRVIGLKAGDFDSPVPLVGAGEMREFSQTFASMADAIRESRQALIASERRLRLAYTSAQLWVWEHNLRTGVTQWRNPTDSTGDTSMDLRSFVARIHPEDRHLAIAAIRKARASKSYESEYRLRTREGAYIWVASWGQVVQDSESGAEIMIGVSRDITEQKRTEQLAREADRLAATSEMAAALAHEINNPLTAVLSAVHVAGVQLENRQQVQHLLGIADTETRRIAHIVRQLLGLYRPAVPMERVDLSALIEEAVADCRPAITAKQQQMDACVEPGLVLDAYPEELRHALNNVIVNASESSPQGGRIAVRARRGRNWTTGDSGFLILVCDNGPGIAPESLAHMLEPFVGTKSERGTGLGLWVTRSVVLNHAGTLRVRSFRGARSGACVLIHLPAKH